MSNNVSAVRKHREFQGPKKGGDGLNKRLSLVASRSQSEAGGAVGDRVELSNRETNSPESKFWTDSLKLKALAQGGAGGRVRAENDDPSLSKLEESSRVAFKKIVEKNPESSPALKKLLDSGRILAKDANGKTVLDHLQRLQAEVGDDKFKKEILTSLVAQLAKPEEISQGNYSICAQATVEYLHAKDDPADYARLVTDLVTRGETSTRGGARLFLNESGLQQDQSGRSATSRLFQSTLSDFANGESLDYDNATQFHGKPGQKIVEVDRQGSDGKWEHFGLYWNDLEKVDPSNPQDGREITTIKTSDGNLTQVYADTVQVAKHGGLNSDEILSTLEALSGRTMKVRRKGEYTGISALDSLLPSSFGASVIEEVIQKKLKENKTTYVSMNWSKDPSTGHSFHALSIVDMKDGYVYLRNPWGSAEQGQPDGPAREVLDSDGNIRMTLSEFHQRLNMVVE